MRSNKRKPAKTRQRRPGIPCPHCQGRFSKVLRTAPRGVSIQRVHLCASDTCGKRFVSTQTTEKNDTAVTMLRTAVISFMNTLNTSPLGKVPRLASLDAASEAGSTPTAGGSK